MSWIWPQIVRRGYQIIAALVCDWPTAGYGMNRCTNIFLAGENLSALCNKELRLTYGRILYYVKTTSWHALNNSDVHDLTAMPTAAVTAPT